MTLQQASHHAQDRATWRNLIAGPYGSWTTGQEEEEEEEEVGQSLFYLALLYGSGVTSNFFRPSKRWREKQNVEELIISSCDGSDYFWRASCQKQFGDWCMGISKALSTLLQKSETVAEKCDSRRKRRDNGEIRRLPHFSATVWTGLQTECPELAGTWQSCN